MDEETRRAKLAEIARKIVVLRLPDMDAVAVQRDIAYRTTTTGALLMDIYSARNAGARAPVVVIVLGFPDPQSSIRMYGPITSWAQLIAASGMTAVIYGSSAPAEDIHAVLRYVRENAGSLDIDEQRIGLFSMSGNVPVALAALMRDDTLKCAVALCGYTFDVEGSTAFADGSREYGYVNATAGRSIKELPAHVPLFVVRAGLEQFPGVNAALDQFTANALALNLPLTFVNHATGAHGFECDEDSVVSRGIIQQALAFLRLHLGA
jgi:dienelactone hydrolase